MECVKDNEPKHTWQRAIQGGMVCVICGLHRERAVGEAESGDKQPEA